jgi:Cu/Ag efflux protein CusF
MKSLAALRPALLASFVLVVPAVPALAADMGMGHDMHHDMAAHAAAPAQLVDGLVRKVDKAAGRLTLTHGALPNGMPGMTMAFAVKDAAWLDQLKEGDHIRFAVDQLNGRMTVTQIVRP